MESQESIRIIQVTCAASGDHRFDVPLVEGDQRLTCPVCHESTKVSLACDHGRWQLRSWHRRRRERSRTPGPVAVRPGWWAATRDYLGQMMGPMSR